MRSVFTLLGAASLCLVLGCAHAPEAKPTTPGGNSAGSNAAAPPAAAASTGPKSCANDLDCGDKQLCIRNQCVDISPDLAECSAARVHFDLNGSTIEPGDLPSLDRMARCLRADHALHVTIEGNADERGTEEYNMALGDKRATAVGKRLESLGVSKDQLKTISYGKENPLCAEHDEACWAKNRRAAVKPH